jgi:hypothetical protein
VFFFLFFYLKRRRCQEKMVETKGQKQKGRSGVNLQQIIGVREFEELQ